MGGTVKRWIFIGVGVIGIAAVSSGVLIKAGKAPQVKIAMNATGLTSLMSDNVEVLDSGEFRVEQVLIKKPDGTTYPGSPYGTTSCDPGSQEITKTYPWGTVKLAYAAKDNRLTLTLATTNTSDTEAIQGVRFVPLTFRFPEKLKEYDGITPLLAHNIGQVAAVKVSYGSSVLAIAAEDMDKPLMLGFPWANNRPASTIFPLNVNTDRVESFPDSLPTIHRPIPPKSTDSYTITLRFGRSNAKDIALLGDVYKKFADTFPAQLNWTDRRPIGAIVLATNSKDWPRNPRGWFGDAHLNTTTVSEWPQFRQRILNMADGAIAIMRDMNAQGAITWDVEGEEYGSANYICDPRQVDTLAPEMAGVADEYFARFRSAGLRAGVCVRPQQVVVAPDKKSATQIPVADPAALLIEKISYAKKRWGVTLFYVYSNSNAQDPNPMDASIFQTVAAAFPDCLLIPERATLRYYAYTAPAGELRQGVVSTPNAVRDVYPQAFSLIYTADGPLDLYRTNLLAAIKHGDTMMYRTWYPDPQNDKVKSLYHQ
jgi:hypothetical protein